MAHRPGDLAALAAVEANCEVLAALATNASPGGPDATYSVDGYVLRTHPDLWERLEQLGRGLPGGQIVGLYGLCGLAHPRGIVYAVAMGTSGLAIRVADPTVRAEVARHGGVPEPEFGADWVRVSPWLSDVPRAAGTELLRGWLVAASGEAGAADA